MKNKRLGNVLTEKMALEKRPRGNGISGGTALAKSAWNAEALRQDCALWD